jgi:hypothetical protein
VIVGVSNIFYRPESPYSGVQSRLLFRIPCFKSRTGQRLSPLRFFIVHTKCLLSTVTKPSRSKLHSDQHGNFRSQQHRSSWNAESRHVPEEGSAWTSQTIGAVRRPSVSIREKNCFSFEQCISRGGAFMLFVLAQLTFRRRKNKRSCLTFLFQWYSIHWNTAEPIR